MAPETTRFGAEKKPLRIGVLCNGDCLAAWQAECLEKVEQLGFAEIVLFVCNSAPAAERPPPLTRLRRKLASGLLLWRLYERSVVERRSAASQPVPVPASLAKVPRLEVEPIRNGKFRQAFGDESLKAVKMHRLDVLLRFGFGILSGEILEIPRFGIWSFHHGDPEHFRGAPPGFWEIHNGDPVTGVILQRLTETLDGGVVLHSGWFKTNAASYSKSLDRILFGAAHFVARALAELRKDHDELMKRTPLKNSGPIYRYPRTAAMVKFFGRTAAAKVRNKWSALFRHQQWAVGILDQPVDAVFESLSGRSARAQRIEWLPETPGRFLADPFALDIAGERMIIAEEFDWSTGVGRISTVPFAGGRAAAPQPAIERACHLSYPYVFEWEGESYSVPECAESGAVRLYRLDKPLSRWTEQKVLIDGFPAVDPTIFVHEGRWWLFCTSAEYGANEFLYAWFADDPIGDWTPHQANPLKVDIRSARPAGRPFMSEATLIRPAQDCSRSYGGAITFNQIMKLSPEEFREEFAGKLLPAAERYRDGVHTISGLDGHTIVDGARLTFVPSQFWRSVSRMMGARRA